VVKILDMGLARLHSTGGNEKTLTQDGVVVGTPDYLAPEQALSAHTADIRADLYSLGCTLYFLLSGKPPFQGGALAEMLLKHQMEEAVPLDPSGPRTGRKFTISGEMEHTRKNNSKNCSLTLEKRPLKKFVNPLLKPVRKLPKKSRGARAIAVRTSHVSLIISDKPATSSKKPWVAPAEHK
jgi:serine/threonine protein kinase